MPPKSSSGFSLLRWGRGLLLLALVAIIVYSTGKYGTGHSSSGSGMSGPSRLARAVLAGGSGGAAGGQFDYAAWRAARDADTIHILITACLTHKGVQVESFNLIKSILRAREGGASHNRKYHFHVTIDGVFRRLLDDEEEQRKSYPAFADTLLFIRNYTRGLVALSFYPVSTQDKDIAVYMGDEGQSLPQNSYKECATQRLKTPFISALTNLSRMLYIDADAVVSCDLEQLWDVEFARWKPGAIFAAALEQAHSNYPTPYWSVRSDPKMRKPSFYEGGMNAGVLLIDADKLRAVGKELWNYIRNLTAHKNYEAYGFDSKFAEQDTLNIISHLRPEWFTDLPLRWNSRFAPGEPSQRHYMIPGVQYVPGLQPPCVEHYAGNTAHHDLGKPGRHLLYHYIQNWRMTSAFG